MKDQDSTERSGAYALHFDFWSELGDGGRRYRSNPRENLFPAPVANGRKSSDDDYQQTEDVTKRHEQDTMPGVE